ncbi:PLC-like phosphodiesterase [Coniochaeta sp. 2T2.1]|nr:PLC-like phosphodiesterase [Coniochaeta sp. 2T2.1]
MYVTARNSIALALFVLLAVSGSAAAPCNGDPALCSRKYSNVTQVGSHNSAFVGFLPADNQHIPVTDQLNLGIRFLQAQTHDKEDGIEMCHTSCLVLDAGPLSDYLRPIKAWLDSNPNEVLTLLLTNGDAVAVSKFGSVFAAVGLDKYAYAPGVRLELDQWPTLQSMVDAGKRLVVFMDSHADTSSVPYILDEFTYFFETPYDVTDETFNQCTLDRPGGASADGRMYIVNHFLDVDVFGIKIPDQINAPKTNSQASILAQSSLCYQTWGRLPNFILLDWVDKGDPMGAQDALNLV